MSYRNKCHSCFPTYIRATCNWQLNMQASQTGLLITVNKCWEAPRCSHSLRDGRGGGSSVHEYAWQPGILQPLFRPDAHTKGSRAPLQAALPEYTSTAAAASVGALQQRLTALWALFVFARSCHIQPVSKQPRGKSTRSSRGRGETGAGAGDTPHIWLDFVWLSVGRGEMCESLAVSGVSGETGSKKRLKMWKMLNIIFTHHRQNTNNTVFFVLYLCFTDINA